VYPARFRSIAGLKNRHESTRLPISLTWVNYSGMATVADSSTPIHRAISHLQRLTDLFQQRRAQLARQVGLTEQQWLVLEEITTEHFMPSMFARSQASSAAAVSKIIRQLLDKELISVSISQSDGRQRQYELTLQGKRVMSALRQRRQKAIDAIWANLDPKKLSQFADLSEQLISAIEAYSQKETGT
jgi:DNA-binding MarR family transcriptional regulator